MEFSEREKIEALQRAHEDLQSERKKLSEAYAALYLKQRTIEQTDVDGRHRIVDEMIRLKHRVKDLDEQISNFFRAFNRI